MNNRIKELAQKAGMVEVLYSPGFPDIRYPQNFEKFAELLIQECVSACEKRSWLALNAFQRAKQIKDHFGIEE